MPVRPSVQSRSIQRRSGGRRPVAASSLDLDTLVDSVGPALALDTSCRILDWNTAFEELFARPLRLRRGQSDLSFMAGGTPLAPLFGARSTDKGSSPERQAFTDCVTCAVPQFGPIELRRLVNSIPGGNGEILALAIHLILPSGPEYDSIWERLVRRLDIDVTWSRYAAVYDHLLLRFDEYHKLQSQVTSLVGNARRCLDMGTGTGTSAFTLLDALPEREVWAVDCNAAMLGILAQKVKPCHAGRLHVVKGDVHSLPGFATGFFDGICIVNALYALDDPALCLQECRRLLRPDGVLAISTPHAKTDVERLLLRLRGALVESGRFDELSDAFDAAWERHQEIHEQIHRFTIAQTRELITTAGFSVTSCESSYVDSVIVVRAVRGAGSSA